MQFRLEVLCNSFVSLECEEIIPTDNIYAYQYVGNVEWIIMRKPASWNYVHLSAPGGVRPARPWFVLRALIRPAGPWSFLRGPDPSWRPWFAPWGPVLSHGIWSVPRGPGSLPRIRQICPAGPALGRVRALSAWAQSQGWHMDPLGPQSEQYWSIGIQGSIWLIRALLDYQDPAWPFKTSQAESRPRGMDQGTAGRTRASQDESGLRDRPGPRGKS